MPKGWLDIQNIIIGNQEALKEICGSLQKEFEYMLGYTSDPVALQAKKNQIATLNEIINGQNEIFDIAANSFELQEKSELCLMFYGVSYFEFVEFLDFDLVTLHEMMKERKEKKAVQLPLIFESYLDYTILKEPKKQIKYADKPVLGLKGLADLHEKGFRPVGFSLKDALKEIEEIIKKHQGKTNE